MKRWFLLLLAALLALGALGCQKPMISSEPAVSTGQTTLRPTDPTELPTAPTQQPTQLPTQSPTQPTLPPPPVREPLEELDAGDTWLATCDQSMSLRSRPDLTASSRARIPAGAKLQLLRWEGIFAYVSYRNIRGYVLANYIKPANADYMTTAIDTVQITHRYTYEQLMEDLQLLQAQYADLIEVEILGQSELGRDIPVIRVGKTDAQHHVLIQGAIHGREHMTAWLCMAMLDYWLDRDLMGYGDVCYHVIPMANPDGVVIAQSDQLPDYLEAIYQRDKKLGHVTGDVQQYLSQWKANGLGVDLNRNFPAGWEHLEEIRELPSAMLHPGTNAFSAKETRLLQDYTLRYPFAVTVSYHAMGSVIYYEYGDDRQLIAQTGSLAAAVGRTTGYEPVTSETVDGGGYKDWAMDSLGIPSLTIEIGSQNTPLQARELYSVFVRNVNVLPTIAMWLQ